MAAAPITGGHAELLARTARRLTLVTLALLAALVIGIGVTTAVGAQAALDNGVDRALETSAQSVLAGLDGELPTVGDREGGDLAEHAPAAADTFFLMLDPSGAVVANPSGVALAGLPDLAPLDAARASGQDLRTVTAGGLRVRLLTLPILRRGGQAADPPVGYVQAGFALTLHDQQSSALIFSIVVIGLAGLLAAGLVTRFVTGRALVPIRAAFENERQFVADASHELRTPVALIRASAEVLQRESLVKPEGEPLAGDIVAEADRLGRLVADLLALSSAQARPIELELEPIELGRLVDETVRLAQPLARERGVVLEAHGAADPPAVGSTREAGPATSIVGDRDRLAQVLLILLDNAFGHSPPGGTVLVSVGQDGGTARLAVSDQGPGIPEAERERIFEPFARLGTSRSIADGGSGLGLAIARTIVAGHRGSIRVDDAPGGGARFTVALPLS